MVPPSPPPAASGSQVESTGYLSAVTPDGPIYWREDRFQAELEKLYFRSWLCVGREEELATPGDFLTRILGRESLIFLRDKEQTIRGFYNVCRHRGTRLVVEPRGSGLQSIVCPYHTWTYSLDGKLIAATHTKELANFDRKNYGLHPVRVETWGGFVWANMEPSAPSLKEDLGEFFRRYDRFGLGRLRLGAKKVYEVEANWKLLVENYSECYHCAPIHPELNKLTPYLTGDNDSWLMTDGKGSKFSGGYMTFAGNYTSMVRSGYTKRPPLTGMTEEDRKRVYYHVLFPNSFFSLHPDYLMIHRTWPTSATHSVIENEFYFDPETMQRPDFDPTDAVDLWDEINRQDWQICERAQKGTQSRIWHGGRYSEQESLVCDFDLFVRDQMGQ